MQASTPASQSMLPIARIKMLKAGEVAELLRISVPHVYRMAKEERIPSITFGRSVRFPEALLYETLLGDLGAHNE
jgi:excisionase family DNA binding protein